jgi:hypothetical protein
MSKTWAIILSIIGGLFLLGIVAAGGIVYWVYQNKDRWVQSFERHTKEAEEFGAKTNNEGCLKETLSRYKSDKSIPGRISTSVFLGICLQKSEPSPGFCDGVPANGEIMKSSTWALKKCADAGLQNDQGCQQIFGAVQAYCHGNDKRPEN